MQHSSSPTLSLEQNSQTKKARPALGIVARSYFKIGPDDDAPALSLSPSALRNQSLILGSLGLAENEPDFSDRFRRASLISGRNGQLDSSISSGDGENSGDSEDGPHGSPDESLYAKSDRDHSRSLSQVRSNLSRLLKRDDDGIHPITNEESGMEQGLILASASATSNRIIQPHSTSYLKNEINGYNSDDDATEETGEQNPLLSKPANSRESLDLGGPTFQTTAATQRRLSRGMKCLNRNMFAATRKNLTSLSWKSVVLQPIYYLPAVMLGLILNLLDAISYGLIMFPASIPIFSKFGPDGVSMFLVSTFLSQLVYSLGGSVFKGGNGSMMIEVVPFLHIMCQIIVTEIGDPEKNSHSIIATAMMAYALSTVMTGIAFLALGGLKLGSLVGFFPRHILVGCIGGVGYFLLQTGLEVTTRLTAHLNTKFLSQVFEPHYIALWGSSFSLALLLRFLQRRMTHPLFVPSFFLVIPILFYVMVPIFGWSLDELRNKGWIFRLPSTDIPFWHFYTLYDISATNWTVITKTVPAMLALTFFGILHVPINVPALGVSCNQDDVHINRELVGHGISNLVSGFCGSIQNYLVYSNSVLFIRSGGDSRIAGLMLAMATAILYFMGPAVIGYIPVMVVGSLIFHLGLELMKESLLDTWGVVNPLEYVTIVLIVVAMAFWGFIEGIFVGILLACLFFVYNNARKNLIRASFTGQTAKSTVRRIVRQQQFLHAAGTHIRILQLQGFMFFGTVGQLDKDIRSKLGERTWAEHPIKFLILDMTATTGMDFSAAEAFLRIKRLLITRRVHMLVCGTDVESEVGKALRKVRLWGGEDKEYVHSFNLLDEALEWCENRLLETFYRKRAAVAGRKSMKRGTPANGRVLATSKSASLEFIHCSSPRERRLHEAAESILEDAPTHTCLQPVSLLIQVFADRQLNNTDKYLEDMFFRIAPHFEAVAIPKGGTVYRQGEPANKLYLVEEGSIQIIADLPNEEDYLTSTGKKSRDKTGTRLRRRKIETVLPGTLLGELRFITEANRGGTAVADSDSALWQLDRTQYEKLCEEDPKMMLAFYKMVMKYTVQRVDVITTHAFVLQH